MVNLTLQTNLFIFNLLLSHYIWFADTHWFEIQNQSFEMEMWHYGTIEDGQNKNNNNKTASFYSHS